MSSKKTDQLRKQAEELYKKRKGSKSFQKYTGDLDQLIDELNVCQIELGLQNDELKKADERQRAEREKFNVLFEFSTHGIFTLNSALQISNVNLTAANLLQKDKSELVSTKIADLFYEADQNMGTQFLRKTLKDKKERALDIRLMIPGGNVITVELHIRYHGLGEFDKLLLSMKDISERIVREQDIKQLEEKYRLLFEESTDPCLIIEGDSFSRGNKAALDFLGLEDEADIDGKKPWELSPAKQADGIPSDKKAKQMIRQAIRKGYHRFEWIHINKKGEERWIDVALTYLPSTSPKSVYTVWRDISDQKEANQVIHRKNEEIAAQNEELQTQNEELAERNKIILETNKKLENEKIRAQQYLDVAGVMIIAIDDKGIVTLANKKAAEVLGRKVEDVIGKNWFENFLTKDNVQDVKKIYERIMQGDLDQLEYVENHVVASDGEKRNIAWHNSLLKDHKGRIIGTLSSGEDITEKTLAKLALEESNRRLERLFHAIPSALVFADRNRRIEKINPAFERIFGYTEDEVLGNTTQMIYANSKDYLKQGEKRYNPNASDRHDPYVIMYKRKNGEVFPGETLGTTVKDTDGQVIGLFGLMHDITQRRQTENALKEREALLQAAMDCSTAGIAIADAPDGKLRYVNEAGLGIPNRSRSNLVEDIGIDQYVASWNLLGLDGVPLKDDEVPLTRALLYGETSDRKFIIRRDDNEDRIVWAKAAPILDEQGNVKSAVVVFPDITENYQYEQTLKDREERLRNIVEHSTNMFYSHNTDNELTYVSPQSKSILGYTPDELKIKWMDLASDNPDNKRAYELTEAAINTGLRQETYELEMLHKSGKKVLVEVREAPLVENGKTIAIVGALVDITERKQAEKALAESEEMYKTLINASPDAIAYSDSDGVISFISPNMEKVLKAPAEKIIGTYLTAWIDQVDIERAKKNVSEIIKGRSLGLNDYKMINFEGEKFIGEVVSSVVKNPDGSVNGMISILRDVTENVKMHDELKQHREHLAEIVKERTREIEQKSKQLERMNKLFVGREFRIKELKETIESLKKQLKD